MINRKHQRYNGKELISETFIDYTWDQVKEIREEHLTKCDWRFMSDQTPSQEWIDYRQFLRDLPQQFTEANEACDAWNEYAIPQ